MRPLNLITFLKQHLGHVLTPDIVHDAVAASMPARLIPKRPLPEPRNNGIFEVQVEHFRDIRDEVVPLMEAFWNTTRGAGTGIRPNVNVERYVFLEAIGQFYLVTLRADKKLVGYFGVQLTRDPLADLLVGYEDSLFIRADYRKGHAASILCRHAEEVAVACGANRWRVTVKAGGAPDKIASGLGAKVASINLVKDIEQGESNGLV